MALFPITAQRPWGEGSSLKERDFGIVCWSLESLPGGRRNTGVSPLRKTRSRLASVEMTRCGRVRSSGLSARP